MKKLLYGLGILLTWYLAGLYRSVPLLVLALAWLGCGALLLICARLAARRITAAPESLWFTARRGQGTEYGFLVRNAGSLPVRCLRLRLETRALPGRAKRCFRLEGGLGGRAQARFAAALVAPACGLVALRLTRCAASDPAGLFFARRRLDAPAHLAVLPSVPPLALSLAGGAAAGESHSQPAGQGVTDPEETRALRDYRPGDPLRLVHWPQTAHSGRLILREPERETSRTLTVFLAAGAQDLADAHTRTAYLELAAALLAGAQTLPVRLRLSAPGAGVDTELERGDGAVDAVLLALYRGWFLPQDTPSAPTISPPPDSLCLETSLRLTWQGRTLFAFDAATYRQQLAETRLALPL